MVVVRWVAYLGLALVVVVAGTWLAAKWADGPIGPFPGGSLQAGELRSDPVSDWAFAGAGEIELQLLRETSSRTVWLVSSGADAYIPAALGFPPNKSWHMRAEAGGAAIIRIGGQRFPVELQRLDENSEDFAQAETILAANGATPPGGKGGFWIFSVTSR